MNALALTGFAELRTDDVVRKAQVTACLEPRTIFLNPIQPKILSSTLIPFEKQSHYSHRETSNLEHRTISFFTLISISKTSRYSLREPRTRNYELFPNPHPNQNSILYLLPYMVIVLASRIAN